MTFHKRNTKQAYPLSTSSLKREMFKGPHIETGLPASKILQLFKSPTASERPDFIGT